MLSPIGYRLLKSVQTELSVNGDDICIYNQNRSPRFAQLAVQRHLNEIARWASEWRININAEKIKAVVFSKRRWLKLHALKLHGDEIEYVPRSLCLGVILDHRMNWKPHVDVFRGDSHGTVTVLTLLLRSSLLYKSYIRPMMSYASAMWAFITKTSMKCLQTVQIRALTHW